MLTNRLEIIDVSKSYGKFEALKKTNLTFENGIYGMIGNNGAGKSTLLNILTTIIEPTNGEVLYQGKSIKNNVEYRDCLGYVPQILELPNHLTVEQYLYYVASLKGLKKKEVKITIENLLTRLNLLEKRNSITSTLSGGQKQRLLIAQSLLNDPKVLFMDEPTAGLDPVERKKLREFIVEISNNKIIILTTHVISDVEYIADKIIFLKKGEVCKIGSQDKIIQGVDVFESIMSIEEYKEFTKNNKVVNITMVEDKVLVRHFNSEIKGQQVSTKLEDVYIKELES